ncbi:MAG: hypothetical protein LUI87_15555 [Lachnospiraceae bacterium]|nr:hypothetical protein [Lachnospiraceae bacterium]
MRKILKLNGESILNFTELKKHFSIWDIYRERTTFVEFAKVHCVPLPTPYKRPEAEKVPTEQTEDWRLDEKFTMEYLDKEFWLELLTRTEEWPKCIGAEETLKAIIQEELTSAAESIQTAETEADAIKAECASLKLDDKIAHIKESGGFSDSAEDTKTVLVFLAICEISEMDALEISFERQEQKEEEKEEEIRVLSGIGSVLYLKTREKPYRFWYYSSDTITERDKINTIRVEARSGGNRYETVKIELYSDADGSLIYRCSLSVKEYRYCNVTAGRIIKFLPAVSISDNLALIRENYAKSDISVYSPDADRWTLSEDFSCFAAGTGNNGFLGISSGKVNASYYQALKDYMAKLKLDMIMTPIVEARIGANGYELLTEDGSVIAEKAPKAERKRIVSLDPYSRFPSPKKPDNRDALESAVSISGKSEIRHHGTGQRAYIHFGGQ